MSSPGWQVKQLDDPQLAPYPWLVSRRGWVLLVQECLPSQQQFLPKGPYAPRLLCTRRQRPTLAEEDEKRQNRILLQGFKVCKNHK